jgi:ribosomal protein S18 acetylase RimI-like enzyme
MIPFIEELSINALPSLQTVVSDGWLLRFSDGYGKRANSVFPLYSSGTDLHAHIDDVEAFYRSRKQDAIFKVTSGECHTALDQALKDRDYLEEAKTHVMTMTLRLESFEMPKLYGLRIETSFNEGWFKGYTAMYPLTEKDTSILRTTLKSIIPKTYFVGIYKDEVMIAAGLGVAERGYVGIYHIYVGDDHRREGLGRKVMHALHAAAYQDGFRSAYLLVVAENQGAIVLYKGLGYQQVYDYWYRIKKLVG